MRKIDLSIPISIASTHSKAEDATNTCTGRILGEGAREDACRDNTFSETSRWEVIERNLADGLGYLEAQDRNVALLGSLLDQFRKTLHGRVSTLSAFRKTQIRLTHEVFARGLMEIQAKTHRNHSLFDDGTSSPLKFHIMRDGRRETVEISQVNLVRPALSALSFCPSGEPPGEPVVLDAICEIVSMRNSIFRNKSIITNAREDALAKIRSRNSTRSCLYGTGKNLKRSKSDTPHALQPLKPSPQNRPSRGRSFFSKLFSSDAQLSEI
jgi:hypothetical protein